MSDTSLKLQVLSPDREVWTGDAEFVAAPGLGGSFGVLARHIGLVSALGTGLLRVRTGSKQESFAVSGGFLEVKREGPATLVKVLSDSAEKAGDIDKNRAQASRDRAQERLGKRAKDLDLVRAQASLARALNRLRIAGF